MVTGNFGGDIIIDEGKELKDNSSDSIFQIEYNPDGSIQSYKSKGFNTSENGYVRVDNIKILEDNSLIVDGTYQEKMIYDNGQELNDNTDEYIDYTKKGWKYI